MSDNIQVAVRCRARNQKEVDARSPSIVVLPDPVFSPDSPYISVNVCPDSNSSNAISGLQAGLHKSQKRFTVDQVYGPGADQALLFEKVAFPLFQDFLQGANVTILAYGQTGSGKTHTMCGDLAGDGAGIIPRILTRLFDSLGPDSMVKMSCIELYKEELRDLVDDALGLASVKTKLRLVPDLARDATAPKIQNLCELPVDSAEMALKVVEKCLGKRRVAATKLNDLSSRSHAILSLNLYQELPSTLGNPQVRISRMNLVDLAGSEDVNKSGAVNERAREAGSINQSLLALGKVINCLSEGKDPKHVPYRESKLTRLLQGLLGGNTKTVLIATVSPAQINASETFSTLNYASKAKNIKNLPQLIQDSELMLKRVLLGDLSRHIARLTRDMLALKDKEDSIKISRQNYMEYTTTVENLQVHLGEKDTYLKSLEAALEVKNAEIASLQSNVGEIKEKLQEVTTVLSTKEQELTRTNQSLAKLHEQYQQQNLKLTRIMQSNISGVNDTLKITIAQVSGDRSRFSDTLELSKRKIIDDLICSQSKLAQGIDELQKLLDIREFLRELFAQNLDFSLLRQEVQDFNVADDTCRLKEAQTAFGTGVKETFKSDVHLPLVQGLIRESHKEAGIAKQRLLEDITNTVESMFGVHQNKFEQALSLVTETILNSAEGLISEKLAVLLRDNHEIAGAIERKTTHFKQKAVALYEQLASNAGKAQDQIASQVEQLLDVRIRHLTTTALLETDSAEKGILLSFGSLSRQLAQSGVELEKNVASAASALVKFSLVLNSSPKTDGLLAEREINTFSPKAKKRKLVTVKCDETLPSRIPQISPLRRL